MHAHLTHRLAVSLAAFALSSTAPLVAQTEAKTGASETDIASADVEGAVRRGLAILLERQESLADKSPKGEWPYEGVYRTDKEIPIGYRIGGTSICATALLDTTRKGASKAVDEALARALDFVLASLDLPLMSAGFDGTYDVRGWGHAYALGFFLQMREQDRVPEKRAQDVDRAIRAMIDALQKTAIRSHGGWNYARGKDLDAASASTFMTAPTLQVLFEAARQGEKVDAEVVARALDTLEAARLDSGAFQYDSNPDKKTGKGFEDVAGAIGRMPIAETTLFLAGRGNVDRIRSALDAFFANWEWLAKRRKQTGTHVAPYFIAPYYFFYAHRYAAQAIECLPESERAALRQKLYRLLWKVREDDGGWNDRVFPRSENFGTAMTLLALESPRLPAPARWKTPDAH